MSNRPLWFFLGVMAMVMTLNAAAGEAPAGKTITVTGHRGASKYAPENTLASFALAAKLKADYAELDVQLTKDGEVLICHDDSVNRTSNGKGKVASLTLAQLKELDAGSWKDPKFAGERFPTLREALELSAREGVGLYIEIKDINNKKDRPLEQQLLKLAQGRTLADPAFAREAMKAIEEAKTPNLALTRKTIALVREAKAEKRVIIHAFPPVACAVVRVEAPELRIEYLGSNNPKKPKDWQLYLGLDKVLDAAGCNLETKSVTPELVKQFHAEGKTVAVWTVDEEAEIRRQAGMGVDVIISNRPDVVLKIVRELGKHK